MNEEDFVMKKKTNNKTETIRAIREIGATILFFIGFLLLVGAVGDLEFNKVIDASGFLIRSGVGFLLMFISIPLSGEFAE